MENRNRLIMKRPPEWFQGMWKEAIPLGNGKTGAIVYGGIRKETCILNRYDLWKDVNEGFLPDVHETLELSREAIDQGDFAYANSLLSNSLKDKNYMPELSTPLPLGALIISLGEEACFYDYSRILDMENGQAFISYRLDNCEVQRRCMVSRANDIFVYEIKSTKPINKIAVTLKSHETEEESYYNWKEEHKEKISSYVKDNYLYYEVCDSQKYGAAAKVIIPEGIKYTSDSSIHIEGADKILIVVKTYIGEKNENPLEDIKKELDDMEQDYDELLSEHIILHRKLYKKADLFLTRNNINDYEKSNEKLLEEAYEGTVSPALLEKLWHFGRYLFMSGSCEDGNPFPLYGLWNGEYRPEWAQNVANENIQMMYWHALTGGMVEFLRPVIIYYYDKIPQMQENARKLFGCRGIYLSTYTTPKNSYVNPVVPVITNWIGGAGWIAQHFFSYYVFTKDEKILHEKILPFMLEAAAFYEDYAVYDENGIMKLYPSVSPENSPANFVPKNSFQHLTHPMPAVLNATMDFAIIKELFTNLIWICKDRPEYEELIVKWKKILSSIPEYMINEDGAVKEWMHPDLRDHYCHRHLSHLYPVFPGKEIYKGSSRELFQAFEKAVDLRELGGQSGWSLVHMATIYARFARGEDCLKCLDVLAKGVILNNFFMLSNDYRDMGVTMDVGQFAPIQLDANLGLVNVIQEMLLYEREGYLKLMPACPFRLSEGKVRDFYFSNGNVSFEWNISKKYFHAEVKLKRKCSIQIELPDFAENCEIKYTENIDAQKIKNIIHLGCTGVGKIILDEGK